MCVLSTQSSDFASGPMSRRRIDFQTSEVRARDLFSPVGEFWPMCEPSSWKFCNVSFIVAFDFSLLLMFISSSLSLALLTLRGHSLFPPHSSSLRFVTLFVSSLSLAFASSSHCFWRGRPSLLAALIEDIALFLNPWWTMSMAMAKVSSLRTKGTQKAIARGSYPKYTVAIHCSLNKDKFHCFCVNAWKAFIWLDYRIRVHY